MEFHQHQAIYLQIADMINEKILSGEWKQGDRIPSIREMAISIEVNPNTVMRTYTFLLDKDILFNKRGIGYFVSENGFENASSLKKNDFISRDLPHIFKTMDLLKIKFSDLKSFYNEYQNSNK